MRSTRLNGLICLTLAMGLSTGCSKKEDDTADEKEDTAGGVTSTGGGSGSAALAAADDVGDLQLASAFTVALPAALDGGAGGSALALTAGKRSQEACMLGQAIKEVTQRLNSVGNMMCHIEVEKEKIKFGVKYAIMFQGQEFGRIFVDNSEASSGKLVMGFCGTGDGGEGGKNAELITITGLTEFGPKGSVINAGEYTHDGEASSYASEISFDKSVEGVLDLVGSQLHQSGGNSFTRSVTLALKDSGLSVASLASSGTWGGSEFSERGVAKVDGAFGAALFQSQGSHEGNTYSFARRAYFNVDGEVVESSAVSAEVAIEASEVPKYLAADFAPASASGWVGSGCDTVDEEVELNPDSAAHQACDGARDDSHVECWDQGSFESGAATPDLD